MERKLVITDFGRDFGYGRYSLEAKGIKLNSNNFNDILFAALRFEEPCAHCAVAPEDCPGLDECKLAYGNG
jgi:hypothetical protein